MAKATSKQWLRRQHNDPWVKDARRSHYRSRAVYKLIEIDKQNSLFQRGQRVIELGSAPGSWSQYCSERIGKKGHLLAIDLLPMEKIDGVLFMQGDFTEKMFYDQLIQIANIDNVGADVVISDIAPDLSGIRATDQARSLHLAELAYELSCKLLKPSGNMLVKVFQGEGINGYSRQLAESFHKVISKKPRASRKDSREFYFLAQDFRL